MADSCNSSRKSSNAGRELTMEEFFEKPPGVEGVFVRLIHGGSHHVLFKTIMTRGKTRRLALKPVHYSRGNPILNGLQVNTRAFIFIPVRNFRFPVLRCGLDGDKGKLLKRLHYAVREAVPKFRNQADKTKHAIWMVSHLGVDPTDRPVAEVDDPPDYQWLGRYA